MRKLAKAVQKLQNQQMIKQALLDPTRRKALVNLATLLGGGVGGLGGAGVGTLIGENYAANSLGLPKTISGPPAQVESEANRLRNSLTNHAYGGKAIGAVGGAALGGFTARQLAKALLGGDTETEQQPEPIQ